MAVGGRVEREAEVGSVLERRAVVEEGRPHERLRVAVARRLHHRRELRRQPWVEVGVQYHRQHLEPVDRHLVPGDRADERLRRQLVRHVRDIRREVVGGGLAAAV